jgi:2,3-bisphosphoglycerate-dependent phosphoglycerate mutase
MKLLLVAFWLVCAQVSCAQSDITTVILVRHAEKADDGTKDPPLSEAGTARAGKLAAMLKSQSIDAVYTTKFKRTQQTIAPTAMQSKLVQSVYESMDRAALEELTKKHTGKTILICGHSNTIHIMVNALMGEELMSQLADSDYENLIIISVPKSGKPKMTRLSY